MTTTPAGEPQLETPQQGQDPNLLHNVRVIHMVNGTHVICNFTQVREEDKFVAYQCLYPLVLTLQSEGNDDKGLEQFAVSYRRWNPFSPYEDHRINPATVISAMPPTPEILKNYVGKLQEAGVDLGFLPNNGNDILGITDGQPTPEPTGATTEGPVATSEGGGD